MKKKYTVFTWLHWSGRRDTHLISEMLLYFRQGHGSVLWTKPKRERKTDRKSCQISNLSILCCCHQRPENANAAQFSFVRRSLLSAVVPHAAAAVGSVGCGSSAEPPQKLHVVHCHTVLLTHLQHPENQDA